MKTEKKKHIYLKFIITLILCGFIGGLFGALISNSHLSILKIAEMFQSTIIMHIFPIAITGTILLTLTIIYFYLTAKSASNKLKIDDPKESDELFYEKTERASDFGLTFSSILLIFAFVFFGTGLNLLFMEKNQAFVFPLIALLLVATVISTAGTVLFVNLEKKINPEKRGNIFDGNFHKDWLKTSDEAEKFILYKASYQSFKIMQIIYVIVMLILLFAGIATPIGAFPFIIIGVLWGLHTTLCCTFSMKLAKKTKLNPEE